MQAIRLFEATEAVSSRFVQHFVGKVQNDDAVWILVEYCHGKSLRDLIDERCRERVRFTEEVLVLVVVGFLWELFVGMVV
jgi:hypothetical protein